jgi:hypothetical protein
MAHGTWHHGHHGIMAYGWVRLFPVYFTVQPGSGYVKTLTAGGPKGARIIYPNYRDQSIGTRHNFWHYDPEGKGWYVYGQGTVSERRWEAGGF